MAAPKTLKKEIRPGHPRLLFTEEEVRDLKERLGSSPKLQETVADFEKQGEELLKQELITEAYANEPYTQHGNYYEIGGQMNRFADVFCLLYALKHDLRYAEKMKEALLHYAKFEVWTGPLNKDRIPPWHSDLSTTRIAHAFARAYDCMYDYFTEEERCIIADALLEKGIKPLLADWVLPETRIHALDSMGHNWWAICVGYAGVGLLALYERVPEAPHWMRLILEAEEGFCSYTGEALLNKVPNFDDKDLFYESIGYFNYGVGELLHFVFLFRKCFGTKKYTEFSHMENAGKAILSFCYPTGNPDDPYLFTNFGDGGTHANVSSLARGLILCGYSSPEILQYYNTVSNKYSYFDILYTKQLRKDGGSFKNLRTTAVFPQSGYALLRDSFEPDSTLLAVKSGFTWNHAHEDAGSFIVYSRGVPLLIDSGSCSYGHKNYQDYYVRSRAHNVVLLDGRGQDPENMGRGCKFPGSVIACENTGWARYTLCDVTGPMSWLCSRNYRSFFYIGSDLLIILDDIRTYEPRSAEFLLHHAGDARIEGNTLFTENGAARASVTMLHPAAVTIEERTGHPEQQPDKDLIYHSFCAEGRNQCIHLMTVVRLNDAVGKVTAEALSAEEAIGVRLADGAETVEFWFNERCDGRRMHVNSNHTLAGFDTDAYVLAVRTGSRSKRLFAYDASYIRKDGKVLAASFEKKAVQLKL